MMWIVRKADIKALIVIYWRLTDHIGVCCGGNMACKDVLRFPLDGTSMEESSSKCKSLIIKAIFIL